MTVPNPESQTSSAYGGCRGQTEVFRLLVHFLCQEFVSENCGCRTDC
jgi:hypothetical protein